MYNISAFGVSGIQQWCIMLLQNEEVHHAVYDVIPQRLAAFLESKQNCHLHFSKKNKKHEKGRVERGG